MYAIIECLMILIQKIKRIKIFYIAHSQKELKKISLKIANDYKINLTTDSPALSGIISLPDSVAMRVANGSISVIGLPNSKDCAAHIYGIL